MAEKSAIAARNAERNNDKLFPVLQKSLSGDEPMDYAAATEKLVIWLSRDKAYYPKARPMTALETVRRHNTPPGAPFHISRCPRDLRLWAEPYVKLVRTVVPFILLFPEQHLQLRLRALIQTICDNVDGFLSQQTLYPPTTVSSPVSSVTGTPRTPLSPVAPLSGQSPAVTVHSVLHNPTQAPSTTEEQKKAITVPPQARTISPVRAAPTAPFPVPPATAPPTVPVAAPTTVVQPPVPVSAPLAVRPLPRTNSVRAASLGNLPTQTSAQATAPSPSQTTTLAVAAEPMMSSEQARHKAKRRKTIPIDLDFIEADLNWYKDKRSTETTSGQQDVGSTAASTVASTPSLITENASPVVAPSTAPADIPGPAGQSVAHSEEAPPIPIPAENTPFVMSRSPSIPLKDVVRPSSGNPSVTPESAASNVSAKPPPAPQSPTILGPSLTRRPSDVSAPAVVTEDAAQASSSKVSSLQAGEKLPSPLSSKQVRKRKRGPPGLKFLPVSTPEGLPPEAMVINETKDDGSTTTRESSTTAALPSMPPPSQPVSMPASPEDARPDAQRAAAPGRNLEDTTTTVESPVPMDVDINSPSRTADITATEATMASSSHKDATTEDAEMRDLPSVAATEEPLATSLASSPDKRAATPLFLPSSRESSTSMYAKVSGQGELKPPEQPAVDGSSSSVDNEAATERVNGQATPHDDQADTLSPFVSASARVLTIIRGASSMTPANEPVILEFELSAEELEQVARWKDRGNHAHDLSDSLCVSVVSYFVSQCVHESSDSPDAEGISDITKCGRPAPWPQDGTAFMFLNDGEGPDRFSISPPFITTVDKCVDLGARSLRPGTNALHLFQYRDHSDRVFAALLHHPTRAQLAELQAARAKEHEWRQFIDGLGRIELRVPRLFPPSILTVANGVNGVASNG
ncbi:hypothetical protein BV20DRAFT_949029 [Pilatotrama ljubarskyi]|nr:hypothetical protein BV20DRAFT_949029 [Pilatotrama ljubarskyi]